MLGLRTRAPFIGLRCWALMTGEHRERQASHIQPKLKGCIKFGKCSEVVVYVVVLASTTLPIEQICRSVSQHAPQASCLNKGTVSGPKDNKLSRTPVF